MSSSEILIYIQKIKKYLESHEDAKNYFLKGINSEEFYNSITEISEKNFKKNGDPMLSRDQFESVREKLVQETKKENEIFFDLKDFGKICLN